jgi:5-amino-6-(5-phosphoribosylamino)uracil reductase
VSQRPYVLLSVAMSIDGYIDDATEERLLLSNAADLDRVDEVRAGCDAILIGATTIRRDNPRLLVTSENRRAERVRQGLPAYPLKATITSSGLDPSLRFFHTGGEKVLYCPTGTAARVWTDLAEVATVVPAGDPVDLEAVLDDLAARGVRRLMVEGGGTIHTQFLTLDLADEVHLAVAPFFVGQAEAPRFVNPGSFPQAAGHRMVLDEVRQIGDIAFMRYLTRGGR